MEKRICSTRRTLFFFHFIFRDVSGPMAARNATRLRREDERSLRTRLEADVVESIGFGGHVESRVGCIFEAARRRLGTHEGFR